ncbi:MAG: hypothetical protein HUK05_02185 [Prevotella sp.]|nr:hypothetical protein [Prevotella sp.]MCF0207828.1 hypothetical protein [Bacteroidaceae bacterium]
MVDLSNFLSLLSTGAFDTPLEVQPMSRFKWQRLMRFAEQEGVGEFVRYGIQRSIYGENILTHDQRIAVDQMYDYRHKLYVKYINRSKPITRLSNKWLRHRMNAIFHEEVHSYNTQMPKLAMLDMIAHFLKEALTGRFSFIDVIQIGLYLRQEGDKVDFNGLDENIAALNLKKTANLIGTLLIRVFGFQRDEIQFCKDIDDDYEKLINHYFQLSYDEMITRRHKEMTNSITVLGAHDHSRISAKRGWYYSRYHRLEAVSSWFSNTINSIRMVEE